MDLCHLKHAELDEELQAYKGRVVFRGDTMKDEDGFLAVFSEQGASAISMAASKMLDAIGRFPGNDSEDSDALGAYTQILLKDVYKLLGKIPEDVAEIWITLPRSQRPSWWDSIEEPVCLLTRNLYGHPLAGLIWEKHGGKAIIRCGFEKIKGWECLYVHREQQLFLSVYVDDFRMAGPNANLAPMWTLLGKELDLEPAVPSCTNVYLGVQQEPCEIKQAVVDTKSEIFSRLLSGKIAADPTEEDLKEPCTKAKKKNLGKAQRATCPLGLMINAEQLEETPAK